MHPPFPLPAAASLDITTGGTEASNITAPATATIPAGETTANFSITLAAGATANNNGTVSISNAVFLPAQQTTANVAGIAYTLNVDDTVGTFTLIVGAQPNGTINICDRTPEVVTVILNSQLILNCAAVVRPTQLNLISQLDFEDNTLTFLQVGDFANLPNLNDLDLGVNRLASLPPTVFDGLSSLTRLNLGTNRLESLPAGLFDGLSTNLETLILDNNNLASLDENPFDGLDSLQSLDLRFNSNLALPAGLFDDVLDTLTTLNLDDAFKATVSIDLRAAVIMPGSSQVLTVRLTTSLPADVRLTITASGTAESSLTLPDPATVTIPAGMTTATFNIALDAEAAADNEGTVVLSNPSIAYTDTRDQSGTNNQANVLNSLVNTLNTANNTFTFSVSNQPDTEVNICGRTDEVRAAILAAPRVTETNCMEVPQAQLNTITRLSFNDFVADNNISALQGGDFANLPNLATLILTTNDLVRLPENVFDGLSNLTNLDLGVNRLNSLPENVFDGLSRLTRLNLGTNRLESLPAGLFDGLSNLEMLILDSNNLASLDENLFDDLSNLEMLVLNNNNLTSLDENLFDGLSNLEMLILNNNNLTSLDENLFDGLSNLEMLILNNNNLTSLDENLFDGLDSLRSLFLNSNSLTPPLPAGLFNDVLDTLTELNLGGQANSVDLISTVSIEPVTPMIALNASQTFTVRLTPPSPVGVLLTITAGGTQQAGNVTLLAPANVTIPAGASFATFDITLTGGTLGSTGTVVIENVGSALIYTRDGMGQENTVPEVVEHLLDVSGGPSSTPISTFTVLAQQPDGTINICNRTPEVEEAILETIRASNPAIMCGVVSTGELDSISGRLFNLRNVVISSGTLRVGDFANLRNLTSLFLNGNELTSLPPGGVFDGLSSLTTLSLFGNSLRSLPAGLFDDVLDTLTFLEVGNNAANLRSTVSIEPSTVMIAPNTTQTLTVRLTPPSPAIVRLNIFAGGNQARNVILPEPATVTIPAGTMTETFDITLTEEAMPGRTSTVVIGFDSLVYTDTNNMEQENTLTDVATNLVNVPNMPSSPTSTFTVVGAPAAAPTVEFTRNNNIMSVDEPAVGENLTIQFDYTISDIPANNSTFLAVRFGTLGPAPDYVPTPVNDLPTIVDPIPPANVGVNFNEKSFLEFTYDPNFYVPATFSGNIQYQISADDNATDDAFNLGITSVELSGGSGGNITIPGADILVPGGRHVTADGTTYAVQTIRIIDTQTPPPVVTLTRAPSTVTEGATGQFTLDLGTVSGDVATVTYTLVVTGPDASAGDITVIPSIGGELIVNGTGDMATINLNSGTPSGLTIAVLANEDNDPDDELVTLTISQIEIADIILGPDDLMCDDCDPAAAGALSIAIADNDTPTVTLTRNQDSVTEGAGTAATFTLALRHVPNGRSTVTFTVKITGSETISPNFFGIRVDGRAPDASSGFRFVSSNADTTLILMRSDGEVPINIDNNTANFNVHITPINDDSNSADEIITYAIDEISLPGLGEFDLSNIMCNDCDPPGSSSLSITVIDANAEPSAPPAAAYDSTANITIIEGGGPAASAGSTLTLTNAPNSVATVTFELAGGTADVASLTEEADIDFSVSGGGSPVIDPDGMGGTFTIPAGTSEAIPTFTARNSTDSTGERITFTITGITFADEGNGTDIPALPPLTINITDPTRGEIDAFIADSVIGIGETTTITFTLSNIPAQVSGVDVSRTEFIFQGFLPSGSFTPDGEVGTPGPLRTSSTYNLTISDNITNWRIRGGGNLTVNVPPTALTDEGVVITLAITAKIASTLMVTYNRIRSFGGGPELSRAFDVTERGRSLMLVIMGAPPSSIPEAAYNNDAAVAITENGGAIVRTLTLTNAPNSLATVSFELAGGTAHVAGLNQADIDFSVSNGGENLTLNAGGTAGTFTIPAGTPAADLSFTARTDDDSTGEQLTFTITGIVFADTSTVADLPGLLTINVTDITPGRIEVSVSNTAINRREFADITFALRNIPEKVSGVDVAEVEFVFRGFPPPGDFDRSSGNRRTTFMSAAYDLTISNIVGLMWSIADAAAPGTGELIVSVPASALTGEAADIILRVTAKTTATLTATFDRARVYDASNPDLGHTINATGSPFTVTILLEPTASYDVGSVVLIEGLITNGIRTLTLIDTPPNAAAVARFTLAGGVANDDIIIAVGGGADMLSLNIGGDGGTFRIPAGDFSTTIAFTIPTPADADTDAEVIAFTITEIDFADNESDIGLLSTLAITIGESPCHRTPAVLTAISNAIGINSDDCEDITAAQLSAITGTLSITRQSPISLRSDDFAGLTSLNILHLFSNALATLPANVFSGLTGLTELHLGSNDLERLEPGLFNDLTNLRTLRLNANNFTALDPGLFGILTSLTLLSLNQNSLATLPENIFAGLTNLLDLNLSQQNLGDQQTLSLPANLFQGLNNLTLLQLHNNPRLISLDADLFDGMIGPLTLNLSNNPELTSLDPDLFDGLSRLGTLQLNNNPGLTSLDPDLFDDLRFLRTLHLNNNPGLTSLDADLFEGRILLRTLNLNDNPGLTSLNVGLFNGLSGLNSLNLRNNPGLTSLDADLFDGLSGLSILNLSNNPGLRSLDADLFDGLSSLRAVNLSNIPGSTSLPLNLFEDTPNLGSLNLSNNPGLTSLDVNLIDGLSSLSSLNLDNTGLTSLPDNLFANAPDLGTLRLGRTPELMSLPPGFLDNVLFNLTLLLLDPRLRRALTLSVDFNGDLPQGRGVFLRFNLGTPMEAGLGVRVPYTTVFSDDGTAGHFIGLSADGTVDIRPGMTEATIEVTAPSTATLDATAIITLGAPSVLYDRNGDGTSTDVKIINMDPHFARQLDPVRNLVMVDTASNEQTLTIVEPPPDPSRITAISVTNNPVPEGEFVAVSVTLDQPLPEDGGVQYMIAPRGSSMPIDSSNNDDIRVGTRIFETPRTQTINFFTEDLALDDNNVEPDMEEGTITIVAIFWGQSFTGFAPRENNTVDFTIEDNDAINLTLGIEDNDDISVTLIDGVYQVRVRESTTALGVIIRADPAPIPPDDRGVVLDRSITATLTSSSDGTVTAAVNGTDFTFLDLTNTYSSIEEGVEQAAFAPVTATIDIHDRNSAREKEFTLTLRGETRVGNLKTPHRARVIIVPDTEAHYDSPDNLTLVDASAGDLGTAESVQRTLILRHAPSTNATVNFALSGGTVNASDVDDPDIRFSVTGGQLISFASGMSGNFQIPAGTTNVTLVFTDNATIASAGKTIGFTITGITFDDPGTVTDIGALAPLNIIIIDPAAARLTVSVDNPSLEIGQTTTIVFALINVPETVGDDTVARTEFIFGGFPTANQFIPNSGTSTLLTFRSPDYDLTISNNIRDWSITDVAGAGSTRQLTVNVPASALTGGAATVTLTVTAKAVAMLTATHVMTRVFDAGGNPLEHPFTNTGDLEFTIRRADPTDVTIMVDDVAESGGNTTVTVTLNQPLPRDGTLRYTVLAGSANSISANDVTAGFSEASVSADADSNTFQFTVDVADDNRIDAAEREEGAINIISVEWEDGGGFEVNDSRTFTITDNDGISLTLGIEDNDDIPVTLIDGEYQVRVRESIPTLDVSIRAEPAPDPFNPNGVILDRSITASLMSSSDGTGTPAVSDTDFTFPGLTATYSSIEEGVAQAAFAPVTATITIHDRNSDEDKEFTLTLSGGDRAANLDTPHRARVIIVPDTEAHYDSTGDLTLIEGSDDATSAERTLTLLHAPSTTATVNFALSGGTVAGLGDGTADISLVVTGGELIVFDSGGGSGNFQIPAGTDDVRLVFEDNANANSAGRNIVFTITGITFDDPGTVTDIGELPGFTIIINSSDEPAAIVSGTNGISLSEATPEITASFTLSIRNLPTNHGRVNLQLTIPQRDAGNPGRPRVGDDYEYQHQVGNLPAVSLQASDFPVVNITIPSVQIIGGTVDIVFTFTAVDDNYDEDEAIRIMFTQDVMFPDNNSLPTLTPSRSNFNIPIVDDDQVEATLNKGTQSAVDVNNFIPGRNNTSSTFALTITNAPDADATVTYTLAGGAGEKYTATQVGGAQLSDAPRSVFIIPEADITGTSPGNPGGGPGMAKATIVILPLHDADGDDEDVTLIIHSITFDNGSGHGDLGGGDIQGAVNGSLTLTITDEDPRPEANYTPDGDISITEGGASGERTLTLDNAPSNIATVEFTFGGGTVGTGADTDSDINFSVSGGDLTFNADGTTGTFTIPADTAATLTFTANADDDSTGERILFTITGITFDDLDTITDIGPLAPLAIIITDPTPASLMVSVGNSDFEIGETTTIVFVLGNVPERVRGVAVARTEFVFGGFPAADQFNPNSSTDAQRERTFRSGGYDLTISANIRDWSITDVGRLTVSVPASALAGEAATVTLTVTANDVAMLTANPVMPQVFDADGNPLSHPFTNTGGLEFTIRRAPPTRVTDIEFDNIAENEDLVVTVTLNQPLPRDGTLTYTVLAGAAPSISTNDVTTGFNEALVSSEDAGNDTFGFTVGVADDNRIDAAEQEAGAINIISVEWEDGGGFDDNTSRTFTITDNDGITLTLDADEYEVRDNAGTLTVTVNAAPNPIPSTHNGVILERTVTANFFTRDGAGAGAATVSEGDYVAVASGSGSAPALAFTNNLNPVAYDIVIENDDDDINETFTVNLGSDDNGVNIPTPEANVTIVPNTTGSYIPEGTTTTIALSEASRTSATRTLRLGHAPESAATVSFELTGGTAVARSVFADRHALTLFVGGGATGLTIPNNSSGRFTVQVGDDEVTLRFGAAADFYGDDETITFSITGITFDDEGDDTDTPADALPPDLTINITDVGAAAVVTASAEDGDIGISEIVLSDETVILVSLTDIPSAATSAEIGFSLAGAATRSTDYTVTLNGSSTSANSVTIAENDIDGSVRGVPQGGAPGRAEATLTFRALNDLAGIEDETIELTIDSVTFAGATASDLASADDIEGYSQTITITDRPITPFATLSVGEANVTDDGGLSDTPNFRITLANIASDTDMGTVNYVFGDGFDATVSTDPPECAGNEGTTYCAFIGIAAGDLTGLMDQNGSFSFPVSSVSDEQPISIFILPREDDDAEDEIVELEITSVTVLQSGETITFNLDNGNLLNSRGDPVSTARITIDDSTLPSVTRIEIDNAANIPESGNIAVAVALDRPLPETATLRYRIHAQANSANSIVAGDVDGGFNETLVSAPADLGTIRFTVDVNDDNRIEPTMEQGVIEIFRLDLLDDDNTQVSFNANNTATFTITDNDKIRLSIASRTVSENIVSLGYTVAAVAAAVPRDNRVVLDRAVAATLTSTGGSATTGGANADYDGLPAAIVFPANDVARVALTSTPPVSIGINNDGEVVEENFTLALTSNDPAVEIADGTASTITIAPDPRAAFNGTLTLTFTESDGPMTRTLNISNVPDNTTAVVSFGVSGGTASPTDNPLHDFILTVDDDVSTSILTFSGDNTNVEFTIPADRFVNGSTVINLTFTPIADTDSESERIDFGVASLMFPSNSIYDAGAQSPNLLITINEGALQLRIRVFLEGALQ